jgi:phage terminase large subunit-like protein
MVRAIEPGRSVCFCLPDGRRLIRTAYLFVPRKFSKTTSCAALAVYDMLFGDNNAQAYVGANSYDQAKICFDEIRDIMLGIDPGQKLFRVNREKITFRGGGRDSLIQCLTANAKTKDGLFASLVIMDEYAQARNTAGKNGADLKNVLTTSMGPRREPLTVVITTASDVVDGPFYHELEGVCAVLRGEAENDTMFASIFMPDVDDAEDDPATWSKVQPHLGITVQPDYYERQYEEATLSAENMLAFRTKLLNIFTINDEKTWFTHEKAQELVGDFNIDSVSGHPECAVAFDLSVRDDFSAVSYTIYSRTEKMFFSHTDYYFPEGALRGHPNEHLYRLWHEKGYLKLCKGEKIDVKQIAGDILARSKTLNIIRIGYDAYKAQELVNILASVGARYVLTPYRQTYGSFNLPVESFEMLAYENPPKIMLNDNPINVFCLENCVIDVDKLENKKPIKISQYRKIDGAITMLMTLGQLYSFER